MEITLTLKEIAILAVATSVVVFFAYCTALIKNLIITVKRTNLILEDTQEISKIASERTQQVNEAVDGAVSSIIGFVSSKVAKSAENAEENTKSEKTEN